MLYDSKFPSIRLGMHIFYSFQPQKHRHYLFMKVNTISNEVRPICLHQADDLQQCLSLKLILSK